MRRFIFADQDPEQQRDDLEDGIQRLVEDGLVHRLGQFVWPTYAAVSCERRVRA